jgi:hypothetical protein
MRLAADEVGGTRQPTGRALGESAHQEVREAIAVDIACAGDRVPGLVVGRNTPERGVGA